MEVCVCVTSPKNYDCNCHMRCHKWCKIWSYDTDTQRALSVEFIFILIIVWRAEAYRLFNWNWLLWSAHTARTLINSQILLPHFFVVGCSVVKAEVEEASFFDELVWWVWWPNSYKENVVFYEMHFKMRKSLILIIGLFSIFIGK